MLVKKLWDILKFKVKEGIREEADLLAKVKVSEKRRASNNQLKIYIEDKKAGVNRFMAQAIILGNYSIK